MFFLLREEPCPETWPVDLQVLTGQPERQESLQGRPAGLLIRNIPPALIILIGNRIKKPLMRLFAILRLSIFDGDR